MLLDKNSLIEPAEYFIRAFDNKPHLPNRFGAYAVEFKCGSCDQSIRSDPLVPKAKYVGPDIPLFNIDSGEFLEVCERLRVERKLGTPQWVEQACPHCGHNHLILFGAAEWQPARYVIELGAIFEYDRGDSPPAG